VGPTYAGQTSFSRPHPPFLPILATQIPVIPQFIPFSPFNSITLSDNSDNSDISDPQQIDERVIDFNNFTDSDSSIFDTPSINYRESDFWDEDGNLIDPDNPSTSINLPHNLDIDFDIEHLQDSFNDQPNDLGNITQNTDQPSNLDIPPQIDDQPNDQANANNIFLNNPFNPINIDLDLTPSRENRNLTMITPNNNDVPITTGQDSVLDDDILEPAQGPPSAYTRSHD
jgi:hypothetical protein